MDKRAHRTGAGDAETDNPPLTLSHSRARLTVKDVMTREVVTASPAETVLAATQRMFTQDVSCVVVTDGGRVVGILTQRDLLMSVARDEEGFGQLPVAERMSSPTVVAGPDLAVLEAGRLLKSKRIKYLPIVSEQQLVGLVTQTDITRGLIYLTPLQRVCEVMSPKIATVTVEATVSDAARVMRNRNVSCVVVMRAHEAMGILSQKDVVTRVISLQKNPARTPVVDVMSVPVLPIPPDNSVFLASRIMDRMHVHRLVVQDRQRVHGIVSQTDILEVVQRRLAEEEKHREFLICSDLPVFLLDADGKITYVNGAFLRLFDLETCEQAVDHPLSAERFWGTPKDRRRVARVLREGRSGPLVLTIRTPNGLNRRVTLILAAARNAVNAVNGWQGVAWDVTDRRPAQRKTPRPGAHEPPPTGLLHAAGSPEKTP